jgi:hypothetical protein
MRAVGARTRACVLDAIERGKAGPAQEGLDRTVGGRLSTNRSTVLEYHRDPDCLHRG